jgi:uncharacterized membrane protein YuzA (DUF378 family)
MRKFLFNQKFRFDLGYQFLGFLNFSLLLVAASDKIKPFIGIKSTWTMLALAIPIGYAGVWMFGWFLDRVMRYNQNYSDAQHERNPHATANFERLVRIEKLLMEKK